MSDLSELRCPVDLFTLSRARDRSFNEQVGWRNGSVEALSQ